MGSSLDQVQYLTFILLMLNRFVSLEHLVKEIERQRQSAD